MFNYDIEIYRGIMFVRLEGELNQNTIKSSNQIIIPLIIKNNIKNVIFNLNNLTYLDNLDFFKDNEKVIKYNKGKMILCNIPSNIIIKDKFNIVANEIKAIRLLGV